MAAEALEIDKEIALQVLSLCNLRGRRNRLVSVIFRLPPEILAAIFICCAHDYHRNYFFSTFQVPRWVNVSYVCRHWRDVALSCPTLWSYHFTVSLRWTEELLARSKQASLKLRIFFHHKRGFSWSRLLEMLMNHVDRMEELWLNLPAQFLPTRLSLRAPRLQDLLIEIDDEDENPYFDWSPAFDGDTPTLYTLELSKCGLPSNLLALDRLTTLSLRHILPGFQKNMAELRTMLSRMQNLTVLCLQNALPSTRGFPSNDILPKINLYHLAHLSVTAPLSTVVTLLSCIDVPLKTQVRLHFQFEDDSTIDDYAPIPLFFAQRHRLPEDTVASEPSIRSLFIDSNTYGLSLYFSTLERDCHPYVPMMQNTWNRNVPLSIILAMDTLTMGNDGDRIMSDICCSLPLASVQSLHAKHPPFSSAFWCKLLRHLQGLRYLKLSRGNMPDLVPTLSLTTCRPTENPKGHVASDRTPTGNLFVPALEELELDHILFDPSRLATSKCVLLEALSAREALCGRVNMIQCSEYGMEGLQEDGSDVSDEDEDPF